MKNTKKLIALTLAVVLMALTLAACGNGGDTQQQPEGNNPDIQQTPENGGEPGANETPEATPTDNGAGGGTITGQGVTLDLPEPFETHPGDADYFYAYTDNYVAYMYSNTEYVPLDDAGINWAPRIETHYFVIFFDDDDNIAPDPYTEPNHSPIPARIVKIVFENNDYAQAYYDRGFSDRGEWGAFEADHVNVVDNVVYLRGAATAGKVIGASFIKPKSEVISDTEMFAENRTDLEDFEIYISKP